LLFTDKAYCQHNPKVPADKLIRKLLLQSDLMKYFIIVSLLIIVTLRGHSQNLVINPGFEYYHCTDWDISSIEICNDWMAPSFQTPDYFNNVCKEYRTAIIPDLYWWGPQLPRTGNAYMGIIAFRPNGGDPETIMCEYIEGKLLKPLEQGVRYTVKLNVSLAECSRISLKNIGLYFSEKVIKEKSSYPFKFVPQVTFLSSVADTTNWVTLSETYTAKGNEKYFVIGCFDNGKKIKFKKVSPSKKIRGPREEAYYFIDDVSVAEKGTDGYEPKPETKTPLVAKISIDTAKIKNEPAEPVIGVPIVLKNIFFETGEFKLLPGSFEALDNLFLLLKTHSDISIVINGYTDNIGTEKNNITLSLNRSKAVFDYLTEKGIDSSRLGYAGYGDKNAISPNTTEEGREKNRRVEFILSKESK
jgi:OOP family OmpA-OmpF porin